MSKEEYREGKVIPGPVTFELTPEEIQAVKNGATTIRPTHIVGGAGGFAIRNHSFSGDHVKLNLEHPGRTAR